MDGWASLGSLLAGGGQQDYQHGQARGAQLQTALMQARQKRDAEVGRQMAAQEAFDAGDSELAYAFLRGDDPRQISGYRKDQQSIGWGDKAWDEAVDPAADIELLNRMNLVRAGKPVDLTKIQGGVAVNPMLTPESQSLHPTEIGLSQMMLDEARAGAARASAASSYASAARSHGGVAADKASNYTLQNTADGVVRINKLTGEVTPVVNELGEALRPVGAPRVANNDMNNAAGFAARMIQGGDEMGDLVREGYDPTNLRDRAAAALGGFPGNLLMSDEGQQYQQAAQNWVRANLRKESGAAIGVDEMANEISNYFPKAGDSEETVAQKERNRRLVEQNMVRMAGSAWKGPQAPQSVPEAMSQASGYTIGQVIEVNGRQYRVVGGDPSDPELEEL